MQQETRICQNCKSSFMIEPDDFTFYEKIKVPPPTWCPQCRLQRRLAFFNLVNLYRRPCGLCGKAFISSYPTEAPYKVYCASCWWSDKWDPFVYGRDYDFSRSFFEQFNELLHEVPHLGTLVESNVFQASPYTNYAGSLKNCYLLFYAEYNENSSVGHFVMKSNLVFDSSLVLQCERMYDSMHVYKVNNGIGLRTQVSESVDVAFLRDSQNCQHCFASANLRNKKYQIFNKAYSKEDYANEIKKWDLGSYKAYTEVQELAQKHWDSLPYKAISEDFNVGSSGNIYYQTKNCKDCFEVSFAEDSRFLHILMNARNSYDVTGWAEVENCYESFCVGRGAFNVRLSFLAALNASNIEYSTLVIAGNDFFGSASIKKGEYCILNKRYSKEEFIALREKIIEHMNQMPYKDAQGNVYTYGEFFPIEMSPWAYNTTLASNLFPLQKSEALQKNYKWLEKEPTNYRITKKADELPDHIKDAPDNILKETIGCMTCSKGFRVTVTELTFLRQMNVPLPRRCPFCRIQDKLNMWFQEFQLVSRACSKCGKDIQTSKLLEKKPLVYCRECYLQEIV